LTVAGNLQVSGGGFECYSKTGDASAGTTHLFWEFSRTDDGNCGEIQKNGSYAVSYNTSSDYRLKSDITLITDGLERLNKLKPSHFLMNGDTKKRDGFIAHEAQEVVPEAVSGSKDAMMDKEVSPAIQAIEAQDAVEWTDKPSEENTKEEIKAWMDSNSLEYNSGDTKSDLIAKIPEFKQEAIVAKEAVDAVYESVPDYQGIDQSKLVPLLVSAVQELSAKVALLEAK
jgi:hypothetical protein